MVRAIIQLVLSRKIKLRKRPLMLRYMRYVFLCVVLLGGGGAIRSVSAGDGVSEKTSDGEWIEKKVQSAREVSVRVQALLNRAREEKETIKITCLDDKFTQINVSLRGIEERASAFDIAQAAGDMTTAEQHLAIIKIYLARIETLDLEADSCMGETDVVLGKTETIVDISGNIEVDPSEETEDRIDVGDEGMLDNIHASAYY